MSTPEDFYPAPLRLARLDAETRIFLRTAGGIVVVWLAGFLAVVW